MELTNNSTINKKSVIYQIFERFCLTTNAHGFFKIVHGSKTIRSVWTFIFCTLTTGLFALVFFLLQHILSDNLNAELDIRSELEFTMPDVTICPRQRFFFMDSLSISKPDFSMNISQFTPTDILLNKNFTYDQYFKQSVLIWKNLGFENDSAKLARYSILQLSENLNLLRKQQDILLKLTYLNQNISSDELQLLIRPDGIRCVIFRPKNRNIRNLDDIADLFLVVFVPMIGNDDKFESYFQTSSELEQALSGSSVYIHSPMTLPEFNTQELIVARDNMIQLAIERNENYLYNVNKRCTEKISSFRIRQNNSTSEFLYSQTMCLNLRQQLYIYRNCKCVSETLFWPEEIPPTTNTCHQVPDELINRNSDINFTTWLIQQSSALSIQMNHQCHDKFMSDFNADNEINNCPLPCKSITFTYDKSLIYLGDVINQFNPLVKETLPDLIKKIGNSSITIGQFYTFYEDLGRKLCFISIYPKTFTLKILKERLAYQIETFFSEVGGAMGLFVGFTVVTFLDLTELLIFILNFLISGICNKR